MSRRFTLIHYASFVALISLALGLRLHGLGHESFNMDEVHQASYYSLDWSEIPSGAARQSQPPLDYYLGYLMTRMNDSDFSLRVPAAVFGTISIALLVFLGLRLSSWWEALSVGLFASLSPFMIYFSQEVRPYAIAICLFLLQLWALNEFLCNQKRYTLSGFLLFVSTVLFLHSRALAPLIITTNLVVILLVSALVSILRGRYPKEDWKHLLKAGGVLTLGICAYLPALVYLARKGFSENIKMFIGLKEAHNVWSRFDPEIIWMSFVVQTEPLTVPLLLLLLLSLPLAYYTSRLRSDLLFKIICALLPLTLFLHVLVYYLNTATPFRPPYAWYLLPITLLLAASAINDARLITSKVLKRQALTAVLSTGLLAMLLVTAAATLNFKRQQIKPDWRAVAQHLRTHFDRSHFLLFDSLASYPRWEPTFYGFERYSHGDAGGLGIDRMPDWAPLLVTRTHEPIFIIYEYVKYNLTSRSRYPIFFLPVKEHSDFDYGALANGQIVAINRFNGFTLLRLSQPTGKLGGDLYTLITHTINKLPPSSALVELHLAAGALAQALAMPTYRAHLRAAERFTPNRHKQRVHAISAAIEERNDSINGVGDK